MRMEGETREIQFSLIEDIEMPPIVITMDDDDQPKVVINRDYAIWLSLHRKVIGGCAEELFGKIDELLTSHLRDQRHFQKME
jgi:hypothetical protein|tara:strand:- start:13 stop:258 length:246 start_codon:yes stop_codon:yes gene_type:complete